jgi:hypothetical protein
VGLHEKLQHYFPNTFINFLSLLRFERVCLASDEALNDSNSRRANPEPKGYFEEGGTFTDFSEGRIELKWELISEREIIGEIPDKINWPFSAGLTVNQLSLK